MKCKPEDPGPWRRPGLGREWDPSAAHFSMKMLIFARFLKGFAGPNGCSKFTRFISFSGAPCAVLRADSGNYWISIDICLSNMVSLGLHVDLQHISGHCA